jgi:hypothetical protein
MEIIIIGQVAVVVLLTTTTLVMAALAVAVEVAGLYRAQARLEQVAVQH